MSGDNTKVESWIQDWASCNADLVKQQWGRDGSYLLAQIAQAAGITTQPVSTHHFDKFWDAYPRTKRKVDRAGCIRIWNRYRLDDCTDAICAALEVFKRDKDWTKDGGNFIPMPSVFLNQRRWEAVEHSGSNDLFAGAR